MLIVLILASAGSLLGRFLNLLPQELFLPLILTLLTLLAINEVVKSIAQPTERTTIQGMHETLNRIENLLLPQKVVAIESPDSLQDFVELWGGFKGYMYAYNPTYRAEIRPGASSKPELIRDLWAPRYSDPEFKMAYYLFLTGDDEGKKDLNLFIEFMKEVEKECREINSKLKVRALASRAASEEAEFAIGTRQGVEISYLELRGQGLSRGVRKALYYLMITLPEIRKKLREHFDTAWEEGEEIQIFA